MRDDLRPFKRSVVHSVRAVLGYWRVSSTASMRDRDARLANTALLLTNADEFGSGHLVAAFYYSVRRKTPIRYGQREGI